ncbi:unnamed protein product [Caenorhabditis nigoni]
MQHSSKNQDLDNHEECEKERKEEVARNMKEISEKTQLEPVVPHCGRGRPWKTQEDDAKENFAISFKQTCRHLKKSRVRHSQKHSETPEISAVQDDSDDAFSLLMSLDFGNAFGDIDCNEIFNELAQEINGQPAQDKKRRLEETDTLQMIDRNIPDNVPVSSNHLSSSSRHDAERNNQVVEEAMPTLSRFDSDIGAMVVTDQNQHFVSTPLLIANVPRGAASSDQSFSSVPPDPRRYNQVPEELNDMPTLTRVEPNLEEIGVVEQSPLRELEPIGLNWSPKLSQILKEAISRDTEMESSLQAHSRAVSDGSLDSETNLKRRKPCLKCKGCRETFPTAYRLRRHKEICKVFQRKGFAMALKTQKIFISKSSNTNVPWCGSQSFSRPPVEMLMMRPVGVSKAPLNTGSVPKNAQEVSASQLEAPARNQCDGCRLLFCTSYELGNHMDKCTGISKKRIYKYYGRVEDIPYEFQTSAKRIRLEPSTSTPCTQNSAFSTTSFREPSPSVHLQAMNHCILKLFR